MNKIHKYDHKIVKKSNNFLLVISYNYYKENNDS